MAELPRIRLTALAVAVVAFSPAALPAQVAPPPPAEIPREQVQAALLRLRTDVGGPAFSDDLLRSAGEFLKGLTPEQKERLTRGLAGRPDLKEWTESLNLPLPPGLRRNPERLREELRHIIERTPPADPESPPPSEIDPTPPPPRPSFNPWTRDHPPRGPWGDRPHDRFRGHRHDAPPPEMPRDPFDPLDPSAEVQRRNKALKALSNAWERTIGPLDDSPALRKALMDMVLAGEDVKGADGADLWQFLEGQAGGADGMANWLDGLNAGGDWKLPAFDLPSMGGFDWGGNAQGPDGPTPGGGSGGSLPSAPSAFGWTFPGGGDSWLPVILLSVLLLGCLLYWRFVIARDPAVERDEAAPAGLGPWPVDPRALAGRADVVAAFEYLSVLRCGAAARAWNHRTLGDALSPWAADPATSDRLARLYAVARYSPAADPLSPADLADARRLVCELAGVSPA